MGKILLSNIAEELAARNGLTREAADNFMHAFVETVEKGLKEDGMVKVKGLGTFKLQEVSERDSVNVNTGERITIKGYRKVTFTPDSTMKELVNRPFAHFEPTELNEGYPTEEELVASDETTDDNENGEVVEEFVETMVVETVTEEVEFAVKAPLEEIVETAKAIPAVESEVYELSTEDVAEDAMEEEQEEVAEPAETLEQEEASVIEPAPEQEETPKQEDVPIREVRPQEPKKHRRGCLWSILLLLLLVLVTVLAFIYGEFAPVSIIPDPLYDNDLTEHEDIKVKSDLKGELDAEWTVIEEDTVVVSVEEQSAPSVAHPDTTVTSATVPASVSGLYTMTITESLQIRSIKDITPADTADYAILGTLTTHRLKSGETIVQLAAIYYGDKRLWPYIVKHNRMTRFNNVDIGQEILIPRLEVK